MERELTGEYRIGAPVGGEAVRAFIPASLPPNPSVDLSGERADLLERALVSCGRLDAITTLLPDRELFLYSFVRREALLSSQIEGTQSSLSDLLRFEADVMPGAQFDDVREVSNYVSALEHGLTRLRGDFPLSNRLIREVHAILMKGGRGADKQPGQFRRTQNWIGGTRPGNAHFVPPPADEVQICMSNLERFIHGAHDGYATLVRAAITHAQFETIHPFVDGNGRTGRLLIALMLHEGGVLAEPLLYLSLYFKLHRQEYYAQLDRIRKTGDWEAWLEFFLEGVNSTAGQAVATANRVRKLFQETTNRVRLIGRSAFTALSILSALEQRPVATISDLADRSGISKRTADRVVGRLVEMGILSELTGGSWGRIYGYREYLDILSEGAEPL